MIIKAVIGVLCAAVVLAIGIVIGHFGINNSSAPSWLNDVAKDVDESLIEKFLAEVDTIHIQENLRELTDVPHMATTPGDEKTVQTMLRRWQDADTGLDDAWREEYNVYLSFPDPNNPNKVTVANTVQHSIREREKAYTSDQDDPEVVQPYAAYSPAGHAKGKLVYANQGKPSDYEQLSQTLNLTGTIAITRYGGAGRGAKAINAAPYGVVGVLVYTDPLDINDGLMSDTNETYPHSWYMPPSGVERGSFNRDFGDLLTPYLAAKEETYRIPPENIVGIPPIPIQPIGFEDAYILICALGGDAAPSEWQGAFNCTYNYGGPGFKPTSEFNNRLSKNSANVMGVIRGSVEPDRYVIYGNHRDSWVHGAIDPSSGTSVMLEITRVLGRMVKQGIWRPRRSIIFGSWGAEEFGLIGSAEYTEQYFAKLSERTIAYINVDIAVFGKKLHMFYLSELNKTMLLIFHASSTVSQLKKSLFKVQPIIHYQQQSIFLRIPLVCAISYHSLFLSGFVSHQAVARTAGNILIRLADSLLLPFNCSDYAEILEDYLNTAVTLYQQQLEAHKISIGKCKTATDVFGDAGEYCNTQHTGRNIMPLKVRRINDQLMLLDRAFLDPLAFPDKYAFRHVIWTSSSAGKATFPGLADAFAQAESSGLDSDWDKVHYHLSVVSQAIEGAASTLADVI
uniref:Aminopeptidase NAALADL1 n=1 Tax=Amphiprion ocellaris TaxID=80972 RepID=A0AAQ6A315_AMPOC